MSFTFRTECPKGTESINDDRVLFDIYKTSVKIGSRNPKRKRAKLFDRQDVQFSPSKVGRLVIVYSLRMTSTGIVRVWNPNLETMFRYRRRRAVTRSKFIRGTTFSVFLNFSISRRVFRFLRGHVTRIVRPTNKTLRKSDHPGGTPDITRTRSTSTLVFVHRPQRAP